MNRFSLITGIVLIILSQAVAQGPTDSFSSPEALTSLVETQELDYLLLDVRTPQEYAAGHIPTARNIDFRELEGNPSLPEDKNALIIVYCRSGNRSNTAFSTLKRMGYTRIYDFGGINRWPGVLIRGVAP